MSNPPHRSAPRRRVYTHLKLALRGGVYRPGEPIRIIDVAAALGLSTTPVREGLCRLVGEQLVEDRGDGFRLASPSSSSLASLYRIQADLLATIVRRAGNTGAGPRRSAGLALPQATDRPDRYTPMVFEQLIADFGNPMLAQMLDNLANRVAPYRRLETAVLAGVEAEETALSACLATADWPRLAAGIRRYAARRIAAAPRLHAEAADAPGT